MHTDAGGHAKASGGRARPADVSAPGSAGEGATSPLSGECVQLHRVPFNQRRKKQKKKSLSFFFFFALQLSLNVLL